MDVTTEQDAFKKMQAKYEMEIQEERQIFKHMSAEMEKLKIENEVNLLSVTVQYLLTVNMIFVNSKCMIFIICKCKECFCFGLL